MTGKIVYAESRSFKNAEGQDVSGIDLVLLDEGNGNTRKFFITPDNTKGFSPKLVSKITGITVEASMDIKTYNGKDKVVLDKIIALE